MGIAGAPVQVRDHDAAGVRTESGPFLKAALPVAGFALIEHLLRQQQLLATPGQTLTFDIRDSTEVAKCLRGKTDAGMPTWDTSSGAIVNDVNGVTPADQPPWCETVGTQPGVARIHLVPFGPVAVSLMPLASCHSMMHPPAFVNITGVARDGWIDFENFGGAIQANQATIAPDDRVAIETTSSSGVMTGFKVNYDEPLTASFHIEMDDMRVAAAMRDKKLPPSDPQIGGFLDGSFDFDFQRGRSAQTFP